MTPTLVDLPIKPTTENKYASLLLAILAAALLAIFSWIPHGQSPDEAAHIFRASSLAHGNLFLNVQDTRVGDDINQGLYQYYSKFSTLAFHPERKVQQIKDTRELRFTDTYEFHSFTNTALYFPLSYIPQAAAIFIGEKTHMKVWKVVNMARVFNILAIAGMLVVAARIWRLPLTACLILLMPMSLFQIGSASSDGTHFAMTVLIASLFFSLEENFSRTKFIWLCILIFVIATHRMNLSALVLLPLWIGWKNRSKKQILSTLLLAIAIMAWILLAMNRMPQPQQSIGMTHVALYYLSHPIDTLKIFFRTFTNKGLLYFYRNSFAGQLGWLDYLVNMKFIYLTHILIWIGLIVGCWKNKVFLSWKNSSVFIIAVGVLIFLTTFVLLLVQWTKFPCNDVIQGVQGRYFISLFILLSFAAERKYPLSTNISKLSIGHWMLLIYGVISIYVTQNATIHRYWLPL